jgi:hypothetical protein
VHNSEGFVSWLGPMSLSRTLELFLEAALEDMHPVNQIDQSQDLPVCEHEAESSLLETVYEEQIQ